MKIEIPSSLETYINGGSIRVSIDVSSSGSYATYFIIDKALGATNVPFNESGILKRVANRGHRVQEDVSTSGVSLSADSSESDREEDDVFVPKLDLAEATKIVLRNGLNVVNGPRGARNLAPQNSLQLPDFLLTPLHLQARVVCVANKITARTAASRIASGSFGSATATDLESWWKESKTIDLIRVLSSARVLDLSEIRNKHLIAFDGMPYPFRTNEDL